jgi:hypothetical protein
VGYLPLWQVPRSVIRLTTGLLDQIGDQIEAIGAVVTGAAEQDHAGVDSVRGMWTAAPAAGGQEAAASAVAAALRRLARVAGQ